MTENIRFKSTPVASLSIGFGAIALSGCQVFGHEINDGIWFPILIVVSFVVFLMWIFRRHSRRRVGDNRSSASGWTDGGGDTSGHGGHTQMGSDDSGGDDGGDGGGHHG